MRKKQLERLGSTVVVVVFTLAVAGLIYAQVSVSRPPVEGSGTILTYSDFGCGTQSSTFTAGVSTVYDLGSSLSGGGGAPFTVQFVDPNSVVQASHTITSGVCDSTGYGLPSNAVQGTWTIRVDGSNGHVVASNTFTVNPQSVPDLPFGILPLFVLITVAYLYMRRAERQSQVGGLVPARYLGQD